MVGVDEDTGALHATKVPSTPTDPSAAVIEGIRKVVSQGGGRLSDVAFVSHGTTIATNAVVEHRFEGIGLIVTRGFRHIIEIARQSVPDGYGNSFFWIKSPRLVPLHLVREVTERVSFEGKELVSLDEEDVLEAIEELRRKGVYRVGVCLLHSYANDAHERRVGELIREHYPEFFVSLSSVVLPEYREYERAMTTLVDVLVKPYCETYLQRAATRIKGSAPKAPFLVMQSNGGVVSVGRAAEKPVTMLLSGPAAGVLGAIHMAKVAGFRDLLTLDVGGTSTDTCLVEDLTPRLTNQTLVENYPVKAPMIDIATVGAGGGSLAWIGPQDALKVGPHSAGADPGPICYGRGGEEPTVTDAALVLGRLPDSLIGGELQLDKEAARAAYGRLGRRLSIPAEEAAAGVLEIAAANQVHGIRRITVQKGRDPSAYCLVVFGGAGGLLATEVADFLEIHTIVSPPNPGNLSAFGLHVSDIKRDYVRTFVRRQSTADPDEIEGLWLELERVGREELMAEGVSERDIELGRSADVRYVGEGHEVLVPLPPALSGRLAVEAMWSEFHRVHDRTFGYAYEGQQDVELVNVRVQAIGRVHRPPTERRNGDGAPPEPMGTRRVYWREAGYVDCHLYRRSDLNAGTRLVGPMIVEEYGSTLVVPRGWRVEADEFGNLKIERV